MDSLQSLISGEGQDQGLKILFYLSEIRARRERRTILCQSLSNLEALTRNPRHTITGMVIRRETQQNVHVNLHRILTQASNIIPASTTANTTSELMKNMAKNPTQSSTIVRTMHKEFPPSTRAQLRNFRSTLGKYSTT